MKKTKKCTTKKTMRRTACAILCLSVALTGGAAVSLAGYGLSQGEGYYYVADAEGETAVTDLFSVDDTANYYNFAGLAPYANQTNFYCVSLKFHDAAGKIGDVGNLQTFKVGDKVLGDYIVIKKKGGDAKTVTEWNKLDANNVKRIHGYGQSILFGCDNPANLNIDQIEYITFKAGFRLFDGNPNAVTRDGWINFPAEGTEKEGTVFKRDLTLVVNNKTKCFEPAVKGYPAAVDGNALTVKTEPEKKQYFIGENFDATGMTLTAQLDGGETREIAVTDKMVSYNFDTVGNSNVTVSFGGGTVTYGVTVVAPAQRPVSVAVKEGGGLTAKKYALPSEMAITEGTKVVVTYDDNSTQEKDFALSMLKGAFDAKGNAKAGVIDTSTAGEKDVTFTYVEGGTSTEGIIKLTVSDEAKPSNITGVAYGKNADGTGGLGVDFTYINGGDGGLKAMDNIKKLPSLIPGKNIGQLVEIKFSKKDKLIKMANKDLSPGGAVNLQPSFWGGRLVFRNSQTLNDKYGEIEYVIIREGFIWYNASRDTWGEEGRADVNNYYPVAANYVTKDLYIGYAGGKLGKPIQNLTVNVAEGTKLTFEVGQKLTDADLAGVTYTAEYLDPAETEPLTGNVTAAMCSALPGEVGEGTITVTVNGQKATVPVTVVSAGKRVTAVSADFTLTANKFALPSQIAIPEGAKITATYSDGTTEKIDFTLDMLGVSGDTAGVVDTSTAGEKEIEFTYEYGGMQVKNTVKLTVSDTAVSSALVGVEYGGEGEFSGNRKLPFKTQGTLNTKITFGQENCASMIPGKKMSDLIFVKFANEAEPKAYSTLSKNGHFYALGSTWFLAVESSDTDRYGKVEYVCLKAGLLLYSSSADCSDVNAYASYFPLKNLDGQYAYLANDVYLTWTKHTAGEKFGTVEKPVKNFSVKVAAGTKLEFAPEQILRDEDLAGVTFTSEWVDPSETSAAPSGNVTANMCSAVSPNVGAGTVTVSLNGATTTFDVTVLEVSMPKSIAVVAKDATQEFSITYRKYAVVPEFNNCQLLVTYEDNTTEAFDLKPEMITKRINTRSDKTTSGEITIEFTRFGKTLKTTFTATVDQNHKVDSTIESVAYGKAVDGYRVEFNWKDGGDQGLKAIDAVHLLPSSAPNKFNGQFLEIKFSKKDAPIALLNDQNGYTEAALAQLQPAFFGGVFVLREVGKLKEEYGEIEYIVIKEGFVWYTADSDNWGVGNETDTSGYYPAPRNIFTKKMYVAWSDGKIIRPVASITVEKGENYKTNYYYGEDLSLDFTINVTYVDGKDEVVTPTREMCSAIVDGKATVTYGGKTCEITGLTYDATKKIGGIVIETTGKTKYSFAVDEFDLSGYVVKMILNDAQSGAEVKRVTVGAKDIEISGYDSHALGKQKVKLIYAGQETSVEIEVVNDMPEKHMVIDYLSNYDSFETTLLNGISIHFGFSKEVGTVTSESFLYAADLPNVADKLLINGKLATEWKKEGVIEFIGFYGQQLYIRLVGTKLQATKNPTGGFGQYIEGETELVETVTLLPGFQYYSVKKNIWPGEWTMADVTLVKHGVVKEEITLVNVEAGSGWVRQFKMNADKTGLADDAITVSKLPEKVKFTVGEEVTTDTFLNGLELLFKYEDGGSETYHPTMSDIEFDSDLTATAGKKTVSVYFKYNDYYTTFDVDVVEGEPQQEQPGEKEGCCSSVTSVAAIGGGMLALGAAAVVVRNGKKRKNDGEENK